MVSCLSQGHQCVEKTAIKAEIWTRLADSIFCAYNHYATHTPFLISLASKFPCSREEPTQHGTQILDQPTKDLFISFAVSHIYFFLHLSVSIDTDTEREREITTKNSTLYFIIKFILRFCWYFDVYSRQA